jgi:hypothetical protein
MKNNSCYHTSQNINNSGKDDGWMNFLLQPGAPSPFLLAWRDGLISGLAVVIKASQPCFSLQPPS